MGKLIYSISTSLDGYVADKDGNIDWGMPSEEQHAYINAALANIGTFLFGRLMYETMAVWDTLPPDPDSDAVNEFAKFWKNTDKIVYSKTLKDVSTKRTKLEPEFDPETVRELKAQSRKDLGIGGPHLAAEAMKAGLIDEYHQYIVPIILGDGTPWLPKGLKLKLELVNVKQFKNGTVHLQYTPKK